MTGMPQSVVVLGGSSEIARALLVRLSGHRLRAVVLAGRDDAALAAVGDELTALGVAHVERARYDARDVASHGALASSVRRSIGDVDLLVVAVGSLGTAELDELSPESVAESIGTNFTGPAAATLAFARVMRDQGHGRIVIISSVAGVRVRRANFVYGSAKAGLDGFGQGLADALDGSGVHVMIVRPGFVRTRMTAGRPDAPLAVDADDVADAIVRGLARGADIVWVPPVFKLLLAVARHLPRVMWQKVPG